jgi:DNA repair photolyase
LIESEFDVRYGTGKTIFVENCNDLFCTEVPDAWIARVISHCLQWKGNTYVFQTKNPERYFGFLPDFPDGTILGTTIETNREIPNIGTAPPPVERMRAMQRLQARCCVRVRRFVTIEPVLDFDVDVLAGWIASIRPAFLNLGADSKGHGLPEPSVEKVLALTEKLHEHGIELREKHNLQRLKEVMGDGRDE